MQITFIGLWPSVPLSSEGTLVLWAIIEHKLGTPEHFIEHYLPKYAKEMHSA